MGHCKPTTICTDALVLGLIHVLSPKSVLCCSTSIQDHMLFRLPTCPIYLYASPVYQHNQLVHMSIQLPHMSKLSMYLDYLENQNAHMPRLLTYPASQHGENTYIPSLPTCQKYLHTRLAHMPKIPTYPAFQHVQITHTSLLSLIAHIANWTICKPNLFICPTWKHIRLAPMFNLLACVFSSSA